MPKGRKPAISYGKALRTPSERKDPHRSSAFKMPMNKPKGEREITRFVDEARADGESSVSALRQFQQVECDHPKREEIASSPTKKFMRCTRCGDIITTEVKQR
jgi:ribosomal protein S27E